MRIPISSISEDTAYQVRDTIDRKWVESLVDVFDDTPPVLIYTLPDERHVLVDGFHRLAAARALKRTDIDATLKTGTEVEALDAAAEANAHATQAPLKYKERRRLVVAMAARHPEWGGQSEIATRMGMNKGAISKILSAEHIKAQVLNIQHLPDTTARAMTEAPPETYTPLARAATGSKWTTEDMKGVVQAVTAVTAPQENEDEPALPVEAVARVLDVAADKKFTPRETQAALEVARLSDNGYIDRLANDEVVPVVKNEHGVYGAFPETVERFMARQEVSVGQLLARFLEGYGPVSLRDPKEVARSLTPGTAAHFREELPRIIAYLEKVVDALTFSRLEVLS